MKKKNYKLYNVMFPLYMFFYHPLLLIPCMAANFVIDSAVILISGKVIKKENLLNAYLKSIFFVWVYGFIADSIGAGVCFGLFMLYGVSGGFIPYLGGFTVWVLVPLIGVIVAGIIIFLLNYYISFKYAGFTKKQRKIMALILAIATAPYLFFIPPMAFV